MPTRKGAERAEVLGVVAAATAGGVNQVVAGDGIDVDATTSTAPIVSIDISGLNTLS